MHSLCVAELHVIAGYTKTFSLAQRRFYGNFMSPATMKRTYVQCKVPDAALERKESSNESTN
jgi:hypothetical protein